MEVYAVASFSDLLLNISHATDSSELSGWIDLAKRSHSQYKITDSELEMLVIAATRMTGFMA